MFLRIWINQDAKNNTTANVRVSEKAKEIGLGSATASAVEFLGVLAVQYLKPRDSGK